MPTVINDGNEANVELTSQPTSNSELYQNTKNRNEPNLNNNVYNDVDPLSLERELLQGLINPDSLGFPSITTHDMTIETRRKLKTPVLHTSQDDINHLRLKVLIQEVDNQDVMLRKPTNKKALRLLKLNQNKHRDLLSELNNLRLQKERLMELETSNPSSKSNLENQTTSYYSQDGNILNSNIETFSSPSLSHQKYSPNSSQISGDIVNDLLHMQSPHPVYSTYIGWQEKIFSPREILFLSTAPLESNVMPHSPYYHYGDTYEQLQNYQVEIRDHLLTFGAEDNVLGLFNQAKQVVRSFGDLRVCTKVDKDDYLCGLDGVNRSYDDGYEGDFDRFADARAENRFDQDEFTVMHVLIHVGDKKHSISERTSENNNNNNSNSIFNNTTINSNNQKSNCSLDNLSNPLECSRYGFEHLLCRIRLYKNQTFDIIPAFSDAEWAARVNNPSEALLSMDDPLDHLGISEIMDPDKWYYIHVPPTKTSKPRLLRYRVELASRGTTLVEILLKEREIMSVMWKLMKIQKMPNSVSVGVRKELEDKVYKLSLIVRQLREQMNMAKLEKENNDKRRLAMVDDNFTKATYIGASNLSNVNNHENTKNNGYLQYCVFGDISHLEGFVDEALFVEYELILPDGWNYNNDISGNNGENSDISNRSSVITPTSYGYYGPTPSHTEKHLKTGRFGRIGGIQDVESSLQSENDDDSDQPVDNETSLVHLLGHALEFDLLYYGNPHIQTDFDANTSPSIPIPQPPPMLSISIYKTNWLQTHSLVGHAIVNLPSYAGSVSLKVAGWRPIDDEWGELRRLMIGGGLRLGGWLGMIGFSDAQMMGLTHKPGGWRNINSNNEDDKKKESTQNSTLDSNLNNLKIGLKNDNSPDKEHLAGKKLNDNLSPKDLSVKNPFSHKSAILYNKYGLRTESSGSIIVNLNVVMVHHVGERN